MSGWRDTDGRTARQRRQQTEAQGRARFLDTLRHRPQRFARPLLYALFLLVIVAAFVLR